MPCKGNFEKTSSPQISKICLTKRQDIELGILKMSVLCKLPHNIKSPPN